LGSPRRLDALWPFRAWWAGTLGVRAMALEDTLRRLPPAAVDFSRELFDHHWSEAAWLYARREVLHEQGHLVSSEQWRDIEARAEAHVVALHRGGRLVSDECEARARDGDAGELHTAVRVLCRAALPEAFDALVNALDWQDPARAWAVADALAWDAPAAWQGLVAAILEDESVAEEALGPLASVAGRRGWPLGDVLVAVLEDGVGDLAATAEAVARLGGVDALPSLSAVVEGTGEPAVRQAVATAALCFDLRAVVAYLGHIVGGEPWAAVPLALGAGAEALPVLVAALERSPSPEILVGLGLLGHVDGLPLLLRALADEALAPAAAEALYLLTGAELHEETALSGDAEQGGGLIVEHLPTSRERWSAWLDANGQALSGRPSLRHRFGVPFDPGRVLDELARTTLRPALREAMAAELTIRHRVPYRYSSRMLVSVQQAALASTRAELERRPRVDAGAWVAEGRAMRAPAMRGRPA
jgi:hypothetical protein